MCLKRGSTVAPGARSHWAAVGTALLLLLSETATAACPASPQESAKEMSAYASALGFTTGRIKCCIKHFPAAANDLNKRYELWAAPGLQRLQALLTCSGSAAEDARLLIDVIQLRYEREGERDMCAIESAYSRCRETLETMFTTKQVGDLAVEEKPVKP